MAFVKFENDREFGKLFGNPRFKREYSNYINGLMERLYKPMGNWGKLLTDGNYGIINTDIPLAKAPMENKVREFYVLVHNNVDPQWSLLNYVNTHWTSFMHILNVVNYWIDTNQLKNEELFTFKTDHFEELERLKNILNKTGQYIFMPKQNFNCFWKIIGSIATSNFIGNLGECVTLESLTNLGNVTDIVKSKPGQRVDTHGGVDISFKLDGIKKTIQCKSFQVMEYNEGQYIFKNISNSGYYNVNYFSFVNRRSAYVFDVRKDGLNYKYEDQTYQFDNRLLKYKIDL